MVNKKWEKCMVMYLKNRFAKKIVEGGEMVSQVCLMARRIVFDSEIIHCGNITDSTGIPTLHADLQVMISGETSRDMHHADNT